MTIKKADKVLDNLPFNREEAYEKSLALLKDCATLYGFKASAQKNKEHYSRVWGRDSMICSLAALISGDKILIDQVKKSLKTLIKFQSSHGLIPSNIDAPNKKVSYGQSAGRIDSTLWFLIIFSQYIKRTKDFAFLFRYYPNFRKAFDLMHLYEFNERHLIYVPKGGDWADEYIHEGYVLYDQLLYYRAMVERLYVRRKLGRFTGKQSKESDLLKKTIEVNYWPTSNNVDSERVYQKVLFKRALKKRRQHHYLLPSFNPSGYSLQFDGFGNSLALLFEILTQVERKKVKDYIDNNFSAKTIYLIPAYYPPIKPGGPDWEELKDSYFIKFSNKPDEYHNGGLWPMITGFYAAAIAGENKTLALKYLDGINRANFATRSGRGKWEFPEHLNGKTLKPLGVKQQAWSAAAGVIAYKTAVDGASLFL